VAKSKKNSDKAVILEFARTGNPWIDAGVVGLYRVLSNRAPYVDPPADAGDLVPPEGVQFELLADRLSITGPGLLVQTFLEHAYDCLVSTYFNVSSKKQKEDESSWNFFLDTAKGESGGEFVKFPKKKAAGAASLLFDKAARPSGTQVAWGQGADGKKEPGLLPSSHAPFQEKLNEFLVAESLKPGPPAGLLIDGENQVRPKVEIRVGAVDGKVACFLVGDVVAAGVEAKETAFPLLGGSRSFVNGASNWPRLSWKADFVGKFVPALAFFYLQNDNLHLFFPQSNDLRRVDEMANSLASMVDLEPNLFRNFNFAPKLGGYFSRRSEVAIAFLHRVAVELSNQERVERVKRHEAGANRDVAEPIPYDDTPDPEPEPLVSAKEVFDATQSGGPVGFAVVSATKKGNVWMARDFWTFQDLVYVARLFDRMLKPLPHKSGKVILECPPGSFFRTLIDFEAKDESRTLLRDQVCDALLHRQPVLHLLERHAFHVNSRSDPSKSRSVFPLLRFAQFYEVELRKGTQMEKVYPAMVNTATWLGDTIGKAVAAKVNSKESPEPRGQARGALFRLRKTRTTSDFMNELARLQFRYDIDVPDQLSDAQVFNHDTFEEFRGFCVVAALSRYLSATRESKKPTTSTS
jgi:hypothetical protein